jgi:hypothetical protein
MLSFWYLGLTARMVVVKDGDKKILMKWFIIIPAAESNCP